MGKGKLRGQRARPPDAAAVLRLAARIQSCGRAGDLRRGRALHARLVLTGAAAASTFLANHLITMYSRCGDADSAALAFAAVPRPNLVSWTALVSGLARSSAHRPALDAFAAMRRAGVAPTEFALSSALGAVAALSDPRAGAQLHRVAVGLGLDAELFVASNLADMYSKCGLLAEACRVFDKMPHKDAVAWTAMIDGYAKNGYLESAILAFRDMRRQGVEPNEFTFSSMIKGCAMQALLEQGVQLHAQVIKTNLIGDSFVGSTLVDMYGKCGLISLSLQLFHEIEYHTEIAWNAIINVYAQHGHGREAIKAFDRMTSRGIRPNNITFVSLLTACSHAGLVDEGLKCFYSMKDAHGIEPKEEHYSCIIDMYGRAGRLDEAEKFIGEMPIRPNAYGWCSLLGACRMRGNKKLGEIAAQNLLKLEPGNTGIHVSLSGVYASLGQWDDVKAVRKLMRNSRIKKLPGFSWVDANKKTHVFGSEDWSHPQQEQIYEKLEKLSERIKEEGYVPDTSSLPLNLEDSAKERILRYHSERIAVAFALISMPATKPIIVKKNLRICLDCHSAMKFISQVESRDIIVRDNSRFHHFSEGRCSCGDYW
ncbi:hypothetical protein PR202_ga00587 [Eleusine coracana subsp. coracana]|uniref:DYW domain-containing protein n=1 Tax=Eleusine coracana subsp. coracana TaxID=191504 RepID=A0AAV5BGW8_ELECO|nr:hypothetical protein PR202_ga00587 [Eleusine coracana subsp. coracana]